MKNRLVLAFAVLISCAISSFAKRSAPQEVPPVTKDGIEYLAPHVSPGYLQAHGVPNCPSGCVEAWDVKSQKILWRTQVYEVKYEQKLESDVQDVFIKVLQVKNGKILVENERGVKFMLGLDGHVIKK